MHALKLRLLAALHGATGAGTCLDDVWRTWQVLPPLPDALAESRGWTAEEIVGIEGYRGLETRYFLPTLAEFRAVLSRHSWRLGATGAAMNWRSDVPRSCSPATAIAGPSMDVREVVSLS